ncbi:MAG: isoprenylcysteine carboxylmethyltransferase family protein [Massilibacteroides sp.]|jgi:protein-S-isoprenylcysteine O-methyltransferase Ste14|nr:isoprenylcysteine carboxylmethyltransferase family protein [Massilibacteroides sp.]MDD3077017.1 isoprenylcysteine carboxylmethyltransferase family protein [Proteiniphilum sp.]MDD4661625.1 isoprenylcysteine carboxylmethyltransferase family protein [Massilibacteroides sp.]
MKNNVLLRIIQTFLTLFLQGAILFVTAWSFKWTWAWVFISVGLIILIINAMVLPKEVIEERGKKKKNVKKWDKILTTINIIPFLGIYILSGLDYRFHWSNSFSSGIHTIGLTLVLLGSIIFTWSMISNMFFSTMVRIQDDRNHKVATKGPYQYVRHPGYMGFIIMSIATPIALGSLYALTMSFFVCILFIIRTELEDKTLSLELSGYKEYSTQVKYKLIPLLW